MVKQKKKKFKMWNKLLAFLGMFVMLTCCLAGTVQAGSYEAGRKGSLNLTVQQMDAEGKTTPLTGVKLELYRVADVSFDGNVHFVLTSSMSSAESSLIPSRMQVNGIQQPKSLPRLQLLLQ